MPFEDTSHAESQDEASRAKTNEWARVPIGELAGKIEAAKGFRRSRINGIERLVAAESGDDVDHGLNREPLPEWQRPQLTYTGPGG